MIWYYFYHEDMMTILYANPYLKEKKNSDIQSNDTEILLNNLRAKKLNSVLNLAANINSENVLVY